MLWEKNQQAVLLIIVCFCFSFFSPPASIAEDQDSRVTPRGTLIVVDSWAVTSSIIGNYAESLVTLDNDNNFIPCLAESWNWIDDRTIEFKLRRGVFFHNGEPLNAEAVKINWSAYMALDVPYLPFLNFFNGDALLSQSLKLPTTATLSASMSCNSKVTLQTGFDFKYFFETAILYYLD